VGGFNAEKLLGDQAPGGGAIADGEHAPVNSEQREA
jgi:hypothetical protein